MNQKNINLFSRQKYFDNSFRSGFYNSLNDAKTMINHLDRFCIVTYRKETGDVLAEIRELTQDNPNDVVLIYY